MEPLETTLVPPPRRNRKKPESNQPEISSTAGSPVDSTTTARYVDLKTAKQKPARPEPPKFRGELPKKQGHRPIAPSPSAPLVNTSKVVPPPSSGSPVSKHQKQKLARFSSFPSLDTDSRNQVEFAQIYGKSENQFIASPKRVRRVRPTSSLTIIYTRQEQESGKLNVAPRSPVKSEKPAISSAQSKSVLPSKLSSRVTEKDRAANSPSVAALKSNRLKGITSTKHQGLKQLPRTNFSMLPAPPLVPSGNSLCKSAEDLNYDYVDPSKIRYSLAPEVQLSRELDGLDSAICVLRDTPGKLSKKCHI